MRLAASAACLLVQGCVTAVTRTTRVITNASIPESQFIAAALTDLGSSQTNDPAEVQYSTDYRTASHTQPQLPFGLVLSPVANCIFKIRKTGSLLDRLTGGCDELSQQASLSIYITPCQVVWCSVKVGSPCQWSGWKAACMEGQGLQSHVRCKCTAKFYWLTKNFSRTTETVYIRPILPPKARIQKLSVPMMTGSGTEPQQSLRTELLQRHSGTKPPKAEYFYIGNLTVNFAWICVVSEPAIGYLPMPVGAASRHASAFMTHDLRIVVCLCTHNTGYYRLWGQPWTLLCSIVESAVLWILADTSFIYPRAWSCNSWSQLQSIIFFKSHFTQHLLHVPVTCWRDDATTV